MITRIKQIVEKSGLSQGEFSERIGIQKSSLSHVLSERNKPSLDFVMKILEAFPLVDSDWLLFGREGQSALPEIGNKIISEPAKSIPNSGFATVASDITSKKQIDKIIIFFKNGSFEVFQEPI